MKRLLATAVFILFFPVLAHAQDYQDPQKFDTGRVAADAFNQPKGLAYAPPVEPNIAPVKFMKQDPPASLREKVDRLLYGIKVDIPPEYDIYGYELRRYMAHIAGPAVLADPQKLSEQLANIRKARIILQYWQKDLIRQMADIQKGIEAEQPSADVRSSFKFNSGVASAFLSECKVWIDSNEAMLDFLLKHQGAYTFNDPLFNFPDAEDKRAFAPKFLAAKKSLKIMNEYVPFAVMVY